MTPPGDAVAILAAPISADATIGELTAPPSSPVACASDVTGLNWPANRGARNSCAPVGIVGAVRTVGRVIGDVPNSLWPAVSVQDDKRNKKSPQIVGLRPPRSWTNFLAGKL